MGNVRAGDSVTCGSVGGDVQASDSVRCGDVQGNVRASDNVTCGDISSTVSVERMRAPTPTAMPELHFTRTVKAFPSPPAEAAQKRGPLTGAALFSLSSPRLLCYDMLEKEKGGSIMENTFKSSVFGGFNRDDVIRYIEKTALESKQQIEVSRAGERRPLPRECRASR